MDDKDEKTTDEEKEECLKEIDYMTMLMELEGK